MTSDPSTRSGRLERRDLEPHPGSLLAPDPRHSAAVEEPQQLRAQTLADAIATARAGDTIVLPAGTYEGGIQLPPECVCEGRGRLGRCSMPARPRWGSLLEGGQGSEITDLAIRGASACNILIKNVTDVAVRRVRTTGGLIGLEFEGVTRGRAENIISDNNRYGVISGGGQDNVLVNCTLARNASLGMSLPSGSRIWAFNNCIVESATGVYVGAGVQNLRLDHNVYHTLFIGKAEGQVGRKSLGTWRSVSGQDSHSLEMPVVFRNADAGDFRPSARWNGHSIEQRPPTGVSPSWEASKPRSRTLRMRGASSVGTSGRTSLLPSRRGRPMGRSRCRTRAAW